MPRSEFTETMDRSPLLPQSYTFSESNYKSMYYYKRNDPLYQLRSPHSPLLVLALNLAPRRDGI
jgi:hypothetical protein